MNSQDSCHADQKEDLWGDVHLMHCVTNNIDYRAKRLALLQQTLEKKVIGLYTVKRLRRKVKLHRSIVRLLAEIQYLVKSTAIDMANVEHIVAMEHAMKQNTEDDLEYFR